MIYPFSGPTKKNIKKQKNKEKTKFKNPSNQQNRKIIG
jgi:hypothetical protein